MEALLPHFERELAFLRGHAKEFAQRYPKIAARLMMAGDVSEDPHVERLIESFALLAARVHKRLDDDFPLFTEALLEVLYPHYLRPFPSCSIAQFVLGEGAAQMTGPHRIERHTMLVSRAVRGVACRFRTSCAVELWPLRLTEAAFRMAVAAPEGTRVPPRATSMLSLRLELLSPQMEFDALANRSLRLYLDGESSQVGVLREVLCAQVVGMLVQTAPSGPWQGPCDRPVALAGFGDEEALVEQDTRSQPAYGLLAEYFAFPEKFNFIDLPLPDAGSLAGAGRSLSLHLLLAGLRADSDEVRLLETITAQNFQLGCAPVVNLFEQNADPIRVTHASTSYPLVVDSRRAHAYEVSSVRKLYRVRQTPQGETVEQFRPFFSLRHDDLARDDATEAGGRYWYLQRDPLVAEHSPGYETALSIVDVDFDPAAPQTDTLSVQVMATNRDLPTLLSIGNRGGDLFIEGGTLAHEIRMLRKPTPTCRFPRGRGLLWRLVSHLSLNHLSLTAGGVEALKEMLRLYDLRQSAVNQRQIDGIVAVEYRPATAWLPGQPFATVVRGTEVRLSVDEAYYVGSGLRLFAEVLDRFFGLYVHANSFTQLTLVSARNQEELFRCPPRNGDRRLV
ncbi:type VI secretion system baseplate subunit TssF [Caldimonas thermodepolymerans]|jgi:type VI secretion protein, VC_A0110 family|uniref:type VI secretion system baseplate subunit TssF n=1 Tax=Caldimonas thermodepolymerans TaxID=215580 RepID=UPI002490638D|nr:type VI secretion system baseplate subunit TssF [Caldimonas thermodepolymerans]